MPPGFRTRPAPLPTVQDTAGVAMVRPCPTAQRSGPLLQWRTTSRLVWRLSLMRPRTHPSGTRPIVREGLLPADRTCDPWRQRPRHCERSEAIQGLRAIDPVGCPGLLRYARNDRTVMGHPVGRLVLHRGHREPRWARPVFGGRWADAPDINTMPHRDAASGCRVGMPGRRRPVGLSTVAIGDPRFPHPGSVTHRGTPDAWDG